MSWSLRYAPHLGYRPPDTPPMFQFLGGPKLADHVRFAAQEGMAGVLDPWIVDRPEKQRQEITAALQETGLECGCVVSVPMAKHMQPLWVAENAEAELFAYLDNSLSVATEVGSSTLVVLITGKVDSFDDVQRRRAIDRLRRAADKSARRNTTLVLEPMNVSPSVLLRSFAEGVELVREVAHPYIKLAFDTAHLVNMGEPVLPSFVEAYDDIGVLQLADMPGRVEVGAGEIDFVQLLAHAIRHDFGGLVELEHDWSSPGAEGERQGIERLRAVDTAACQAAANE